MRPGAALAPFLAALLAAALVARPLLHGVPLGTVLALLAAFAGQALLPGVLLVRGLRLRGASDPWLLAGQGATLGVALQGLALIAGRALGASWLPTVLALASAAAGLALARRRAREVEPEPAPVPALPAALLAVALVAALLQPLASASRPSEPVPFDLLFHSGTASELRHRWPLQDPRVAGVPLHYHLLSYALPIEAADLAGAPVADTLLAVAPPLFVVLLALQLQNAGRVLFRDARAGVAGAAIALGHADPGQLLGLGPSAFNSHLASAVYGSPTTVCSFVLLCGLTLSLDAWLETRRRRELVAAALLAVAASAAKTTLLPVVLGGLALGTSLALWSRKAGSWRPWATCLLVLAACGAPFTLWQSLSASSYSRMASLGLATAFSSSGFKASVAAWLGPGTALTAAATPPLALLWLAGFLGLAGVGSAIWLARRREPLGASRLFALCAAAVAVVLTLLVDAPGLSQLFLLYNGQLLLCLFAGAGLAQAFPPRRPAGLAVAALLLVAALPSLAKLAQGLPAMLAADIAAPARPRSPIDEDYARGLAWLRGHAAHDAVIFADNPSLLLSALGEVRLYYETGLYTARSWEVGPAREPFPERARLQQRLLRRPDREAIAEARRAVASRARLLIVADAVQSSIVAGFVRAAPGPVPARRLFPEALFERRFANAAMHVYEAREQP